VPFDDATSAGWHSYLLHTITAGGRKDSTACQHLVELLMISNMYTWSIAVDNYVLTLNVHVTLVHMHMHSCLFVSTVLLIHTAFQRPLTIEMRHMQMNVQVYRLHANLRQLLLAFPAPLRRAQPRSCCGPCSISSVSFLCVCRHLAAHVRRSAYRSPQRGSSTTSSSCSSSSSSTNRTGKHLSLQLLLTIRPIHVEAHSMAGLRSR
jgi:hypothetical protein